MKKNYNLKVQLNEEQKEAIEKFYNYDVSFITGDFGSGKSLAAVYAALSSFRKKQFGKIWITRPILKNVLSTLPGNIDEKMHPYVFPILQNLDICQGREETVKMRKDGLIEIMPVSVAKGVTFMNSVVIIDEFQDMDYEDFRTLLTRLGKDSKMIFCGSEQQIDKSMKKSTCFNKIKKLEQSNIVGYTQLIANHRNPILTEIINYLENE